jgi:acetyl-CoA C-acetyltransferase
VIPINSNAKSVHQHKQFIMSSIKQPVIISAVRTPVGKFLGALKGFKATQLGAIVVREAVRRAGVKPEDVDEVIMGCVIQAGLGQNPARQAALHGGLPNTCVCGNSKQGLRIRTESNHDGRARRATGRYRNSRRRWHGINVNAPYLVPKAREGYRLGNGQMLDAIIQDGCGARSTISIWAAPAKS